MGHVPQIPPEKWFWYEICDSHREPAPSFSFNWEMIVEQIRAHRDHLTLCALPKWEEAVSAGIVLDRNGYLSLMKDLAIRVAIRDLEERCDADEIALIHLVRILDEIDHSISRLYEKMDEYSSALSSPLPHEEPDRTVKVRIDSLAHDTTHPLSHLAKSIQRMHESRVAIAKTVREYAQKTLPNMSALCGPLVSARLLARAGSKHHLAYMPAASLQVLGAGPSLFMHMRTGSDPPKHGIIYQYKGVHHAKRRVKGRVSRVLASQLAIAARIDYFRGSRDDDFVIKAGEKICRAGKER